MPLEMKSPKRPADSRKKGHFQDKSMCRLFTRVTLVRNRRCVGARHSRVIEVQRFGKNPLTVHLEHAGERISLDKCTLHMLKNR
jgi:hypothetical protein